MDVWNGFYYLDSRNDNVWLNGIEQQSPYEFRLSFIEKKYILSYFNKLHETIDKNFL